MMNDCTNEPQCPRNYDENEVKPLLFNNSIYKCTENKTNEDDQLTIWDSEKHTLDNKCNRIFDVRFDESHENVILEEQISNDDQCICINAWKQLKQVFELTDEELKKLHPLKNSFPDDIFYSMPIDLNDDDCGDNIKDFNLDGEYIYPQLDVTKDINQDNETKISITPVVKENEAMLDEPQEKPVDNKISNNPVNSENKLKIQKHSTKENDTTNTNKTKTIGFDEPNKSNKNEKNKSVIKKKRVKNVKVSKKINNCCIEIVPPSSLLAHKIEEKEKNIKYLYTFGELYRGGIRCGHKDCIDCYIPIPKNKSWITERFLSKQRQKANEKRMLQKEDQQGQLMPEKDKRSIITVATDENSTKKKDKPLKVSPSNHTTTLSIDGEMKKIVNTKDVVPSSVPAEAGPFLELNKNDGVYTITMNGLTDSGRLDTDEEPVVIRLGAQLDNTDTLSSCSSFNFQFVPPAAIRALRPQKTFQDVSTTYKREHFLPFEKKKGDKNRSAAAMQN